MSKTTNINVNVNFMKISIDFGDIAFLFHYRNQFFFYKPVIALILQN